MMNGELRDALLGGLSIIFHVKLLFDPNSSADIPRKKLPRSEKLMGTQTPPTKQLDPYI